MDPNYSAALRRDGLKGARLGVLHQAYDTPTLDRGVDAVLRGVLDELRNLGAEVIDPAKLAAALLQLAALEQPSARFAAGADAVAHFETKARSLLSQADAHRELSSSLGHNA